MLLRAAIIIVLGFIAFASMLPAPFRVMDDRISIIDNPMIKSVNNIPQIFREGYFHDQAYYRPIINLSFMGEYNYYGLNSFFYNFDNLILHIFNALLVFLLVSMLMDNKTIGFWTGVLFVLHPVQWEAVCNIPGRAILLSAFFELISFVLFLEFYLYRRWWCGVLVLFTFFLGLLCKESAGVLPFVIMAFLALDQSTGWSKKLTALWPFGVMILAYGLLRKYLGIIDIHQTSWPMAYWLGFVTFLRSLITDLRLFIFPLDLHYDRSLNLLTSMHDPQAICTCIFWAVVLGLLGYYRRSIRPFIWFLIFWFALELFPVSQLVVSIGVGAGRISTADHFLYLACIPVMIGMVKAFEWVYELNRAKGMFKPAMLKVVAGCFLVFLLSISVEQSIYASNEYSMVSRSLAIEPNNPRLQGEMGMLGVFRGDILDAEKHFRAAIKAEPFNPSFHIALGTTLCREGRWIEGLEQLVALPPGKYKAMVEDQEALTMGHIRDELAQGKTYDARGWLAIGIYNDLHGRSAEAIDAFLKCVRMDPGQPDAWFNLGVLYEAQKDWPKAREAFQKLLSLPDLSDFQRVHGARHLAEIEGR